MTFSVETATVYRGGRRRWFSREAAERAEARAIIKKRCECSRGHYDEPDYICHYHRDQDRYRRMIKLLVLMFIRKEQRP